MKIAKVKQREEIWKSEKLNHIVILTAEESSTFRQEKHFWTEKYLIHELIWEKDKNENYSYKTSKKIKIKYFKFEWIYIF